MFNLVLANIPTNYPDNFLVQLPYFLQMSKSFVNSELAQKKATLLKHFQEDQYKRHVFSQVLLAC